MISWLLFPSPHRYFLTTFEQWEPFPYCHIKKSCISKHQGKQATNWISVSFFREYLEIPFFPSAFPIMEESCQLRTIISLSAPKQEPSLSKTIDDLLFWNCNQFFDAIYLFYRPTNNSILVHKIILDGLFHCTVPFTVDPPILPSSHLSTLHLFFPVVCFFRFPICLSSCLMLEGFFLIMLTILFIKYEISIS